VNIPNADLASYTEEEKKNELLFGINAEGEGDSAK
jgi:hypothetical protein